MKHSDGKGVDAAALRCNEFRERERTWVIESEGEEDCEEVIFYSRGHCTTTTSVDRIFFFYYYFVFLEWKINK